jgi:hypothetical protein
MIMITGAIATAKDIVDDVETESHLQDIKGMILGDAFEVGAKLRSSEAGGMYVLRMENAAIIRKNAQFEGEMDEEHGTTIREAIDEFRELFKQWLATFEKDEYKDEWGLFI